MTIQKLPIQIANQIAAGEVVERPASIVKECIENALDAQASHIQVTIKSGGLELIQILDDGKGIPKEELSLALERHATSKIQTAEDLASISSLGFRGEALASISAVAKVTIISQPKTQPMPWAFDSQSLDTHQAAGTLGSCIQVRDLFYNVPARKRFLKSAKTEQLHIEEVFRRQALAAPRVGFSLKIDDRIVYELAPCLSFDQMMPRLKKIFSNTFAEQAHFIEEYHGDLTLKGWVTKQAGARRQPDRQYCFVNNRCVKDKLFSHAVNSAQQSLIQQGLYPAYALYLSLPESDVDVNVHPTKHEVRFNHARLVHDFIQNSLEKVDQCKVTTIPSNTFSAKASSMTSAPLSRSAAVANPYLKPNGIAREPLKSCSQGKYRLLVQEGEWVLIDTHKALSHLKNQTVHPKPQPCLFPETLQLSPKEWEQFDAFQQMLQVAGWGVKELSNTELSIWQVPFYVPMKALSATLLSTLETLSKDNSCLIAQDLVHLMSDTDLTPYLTAWLEARIAVRVTEQELELLWSATLEKTSKSLL